MDRVHPRKFEFALMVVVIGLIALLLFRALRSAHEEVEESTVQAEAAAMRVELLDRLTHRELYGGKLPESRNPLRWVVRELPGYLGELDVPPSQGGVWYFDRQRQELIYRFHSGREARFRLVRGTEMDKVQGGLSGIGLRRVDDGR